ncbi:MAG: outer membrane beta-barrel protein [Devosia sp.]
MFRSLALPVFALAALCASSAFAQDGSAWDGFYAGVYGGYWAGNETITGSLAPDPGFPSSGDLPAEADLAGYTAGGQAGYNWTAGGVVIGAELDIGFGNAGYVLDSTGGLTNHREMQLNMTGAATVKVGIAAGSLMPYVLGGLAVARTTTTAWGDVIGVLEERPLSATATHYGYVLGLGAAARVGDAASIFIEGRYEQYAPTELDIGDGGTSTLTGASIRAGINFDL